MLIPHYRAFEPEVLVPHYRAFEPEVLGEAAQGLVDISAPAALPVLHTCLTFPSVHSTFGSSSGETRMCASLNLVAALVVCCLCLNFFLNVGRSVSQSISLSLEVTFLIDDFFAVFLVLLLLWPECWT